MPASQAGSSEAIQRLITSPYFSFTVLLRLCDLVIEIVPFAYVRYFSLRRRIDFWIDLCMVHDYRFLGWTDFAFVLVFVIGTLESVALP